MIDFTVDKTMTLEMIVATDAKGTIGFEGGIPWFKDDRTWVKSFKRLDLQRFRRLTMGHTVVMGRKTRESLGKPLDGRYNIVLSRGSGLAGFKTISSISDLPGLTPTRHSSDPIFVIGGAQIYKLLLPFTRRLYLSILYDTYEGDTKFPLIDYNDWYQDREEYDGYAFVTLSRKL